MVRVGVLIAFCLAASMAKAQQTLGIGVLCSYALVVGLKAYQEACHPTRAAEAAFLDPLIAKHRWFVAENDGWTAARHAAFEAEQGAQVADCAREDLATMMETMFAEPERLTKGVELQLAQGRKPDWGVCF